MKKNDPMREKETKGKGNGPKRDGEREKKSVFMLS